MPRTVYQWGSVILADTDRGDVIEDESLNGERLAQVEELLRAEAAQPINRGNNRQEVTFTVSRIHPDPVCARNFIFTHAQALAAETADNVTFKNGDFKPNTLNDALVRAERGRRIGLTTYHTYTILGGYFT
jgi:hypothetical protein